MSDTPLEQAERHVRENQERIDRQKDLVLRLEHDKVAAKIPAARALLEELGEFQRKAVEQARLEREKLDRPGEHS